ncbi:MauE/DoxX family redox-associated membrane protein [Actinomadura nitritigenes]|uniref:MauE/DoxX family redox-associated membrane protein n=1 Tax=Actinomadura nitritigenes TaxID=134602 RepID=UPI0036831558
MDEVVTAVRVLLALVFVASAAGKLRGRGAYARFTAATARLVPRPVAAIATRWIAAAVVGAEAAVVVLLLLPVTAAAGFALAAVLLAAFTAAIVRALARGDRAPCACFGDADTPLGPRQVVRNLSLATAALAGLGATLSGGSHLPGATGALFAVAAGCLAALLVLAADDIIELFRP